MEQLNPQANSKIGGRGEMSRSSSVPGARVGPRSSRMEVSRVWPNSAKVGNGDRGGVTGGRSGCGGVLGGIYPLRGFNVTHCQDVDTIDLQCVTRQHPHLTADRPRGASDGQEVGGGGAAVTDTRNQTSLYHRKI